MGREEPFFKKCCWIVPLRTCLQVWAALKAAADLILLVFLIYLVCILEQYHEMSHGLSLGHGLIVIICILILDCIFMLVLTVGICTKNVRTLRVYFYYSIYMVIVSGAAFFIFSINGLVTNFVELYAIEFSIIAVLLLLNFGIDICIIFTLKSEMIKLRNKQQYGFMAMSSLAEDNVVGRYEPEPFQADQLNVTEIN